jgi:hypothetical protein
MTSILLPSSPPLTRPTRRVLIVSPHFPPINAPDHQRIRTALPYLQEFGWEPHILTVYPDHVPHPQDPYLEQTLPSDLPITRTTALPAKLTSKVGLGNVGWRCLPFFKQMGDRLLATGSFDLVFFSTTIFPVMTLGPHWKRAFNVPYVLDFQDPWRSDYHRSRVSCPPGGRLKYGITQALARWCEPIALKQVDHVISVSPAYPDTLRQRYSWLRDEQFTILPFGAPEQDFAALPNLKIRQSIFNPNDGKRHWVYVGRGGADMAIALRALFLAIRQERDRHPELWRSVQLHFVGTSYAPPPLAVKTIEPIAAEMGLADLVTEHPYRIPYFEAQQLLVESDAILVVGSDDPSYTASKIYPCILSNKPILGILHEQSSAVDILRRCQAGDVTTFNQTSSQQKLANALRESLDYLIRVPSQTQASTNWQAFQPYTAYEMTRRLCDVFARVGQTTEGKRQSRRMR